MYDTSITLDDENKVEDCFVYLFFDTLQRNIESIVIYFCFREKRLENTTDEQS